MNEQERFVQIAKATANLRRAKRGLLDKSYSQQQVDEMQRILNELQGFTPIPTQLEKVEVEEKPTRILEPIRLDDSAKELLNSLIKRRDEVLAEKGFLSNKLHTIPIEDDCPELVTQILEYRNVWREINAKIKFVQQHGCLPEDNASKQIDEVALKQKYEIIELYQLKEDIDNTASNLSKAKKNAKLATNLLKKAGYERKVVELEWKLSQMKTVYNTRK